MAFNPSGEVAVARDAAKALGADRVIVFYTKSDRTVGCASYGETKSKCASAKRVVDRSWDQMLEMLGDES